MRTRSEWFLNGSRPRVLSSLEIQSCNEEDCTCPMTIGSTMDFDMHIHTNPDMDDENMDLDITMLTGHHQDPTATGTTTTNTKSCFLTVPGQQPQQRHHHHHHHHPILLDSKYSLLSGSYDNLNNHKNCIIHNNLYSSSSSLSLSSCSSSTNRNLNNNNNNNNGKTVGNVTVVDYGLTATSRHVDEQYRRDQHLRLRRIRTEQQQLRLQLDNSAVVSATADDDEESNRSNNLSTILLTVLDFLF